MSARQEHVGSTKGAGWRGAYEVNHRSALWGTTDAESVRALLPEPGVLVVKDGAVGATAFTHERTVFEPAIPVDVVEAVGSRGRLRRWLPHRHAPIAERLRRGHVAAAAALSTTADM